ncbi:MAG: hypothetical protein DHS20C02_12970 [Micavibrio sp.]|nr:MAG: hypothetical protein DHS20C02_12970 [Micavibrio sp.]
MGSSKVKNDQEEQQHVTLDEAVTLAQGHHQSGNYILAERTYRDILRSVPDHFPTTQFLGVLLFQSGNYDEAKYFLKLALDTEPEDHNCWNNYGGVLTAVHEYEEALDAYNRALKAAPTYLDALNNKSYTLWLLGRLDEAEEACHKALEVAPDSVVALNNLGIILSKQIKFEESIDIWEKASELSPDEAMVWINWGNILREMGRLSESEEKCRKAIELAPDNPEALNNLGNALRDQSKPEEAIEYYRKAANIKPDYHQVHNNMAIAYADNCRFEESAIAAKYAVAFKDDFADGYINLSRALCELGDYEPAHRAAQRSIHLDPENPETYLGLADVLLKSDQFDDGEAVLQEALKKEPNSARAYMKLCEIRDNMNDFEGAIEAIDKAIEISPDMAQPWMRKAMTYYLAGEVEAALETVDKALQLSPKWTVALQQKAEMLVAINENEQAEEIIREIFKVTKELPGTYGTLTSIKKFKSEDDEDFQNMLDLEDKVESFGQNLAAALYFAISDAYEQMKKYDQSFEYLKRANDIKRKSVPYITWKDMDYHGLVKEKYTPQLLKQNEGKGCDSDVPVFIVGMPRSGTTLTEQILAAHPDVLGAGELPYMGKVDKMTRHQSITDAKTLGEEYLKLARTKDKDGDAKRIVDKMPANYMFVGFIASILPNAKIIHCRRNPIDTCLSCYKQNFARGQYWSYNLEELADAYKRYLDLMEYWKEVLPGRILEVDYETTVNNLEDEAKRLIDHIGLEWNDACLEPHKQKRNVITASKAQVTKPVYNTSVEKWRRYEEQLQPLVQELMPSQALKKNLN